MTAPQPPDDVRHITLVDEGAAAPTIQTKSYNRDEHLDASRQKIALRVLWIFVGVLAGGLVLVGLTCWTKLQAQTATDVFRDVFTPMVGIVSGVLGFYFGAERARRGGKNRS